MLCELWTDPFRISNMLLTKMLLLYYPFFWSSTSSFSPPPSHPRRQVNNLVKTCNFDLPSKELHQVLSTASRSPHKKCCGQKMETDPSTLLKCIIISRVYTVQEAVKHSVECHMASTSCTSQCSKARLPSQFLQSTSCQGTL